MFFVLILWAFWKKQVILTKLIKSVCYGELPAKTVTNRPNKWKQSKMATGLLNTTNNLKWYMTYNHYKFVNNIKWEQTLDLINSEL